MKIDKSWATDMVSVLLILCSFALKEPYAQIVLLTGLFALSGAVTNQIAIHMLFEKVPFFYGSGVVELRFEAFKTSIKELMMSQFFTKEQFDIFMKNEQKSIDFKPILSNIDLSSTFDSLVKTVMESPLGGMLTMFGGAGALEGLRVPFEAKLRASMVEISKSEDFLKQINNSSFGEDLLGKIEQMIDSRLNELTPKMVKEIVQKFIKDHLGWLVVWGGFFGGLIGLVSNLLV